MDIGSRLGEFNKESTYLVYCRSGGRSRSAINTLKTHGFNAINMEGGMNNWEIGQLRDAARFIDVLDIYRWFIYRS
jgi:rhodanese-related sulfurtransferase